MSIRTKARTNLAWTLDHGIPRLVVRALAKRGDLQGRLILESRQGGDVSGLIEDVRAAGPLNRTKLTLISADHAVTKEVLTHPDLGSGTPGQRDGLVGRLSQWAMRGRLHPLLAPSLLVTEPPDHTRYRKLVTRVFTARAIEDLRGRTEKIAAELLDDLERRSREGTTPFDLVEHYCSQLPLIVIAEILGVPPQDWPKVLRFGSMAAPSLDFGLDRPTFTMVTDGLAEFDQWLGAHFERLRANPGDDLFSRLLRASDEEGLLDERELKSTAGLVLAAGFETTVNLLGNGTALLHAHPDQLDRLRADPSLWANAVDEVLRLDPPVLLTGRISTRDTTVAGIPVRAGSQLVTILAGANRDPAVFTDPDSFDVTRENARDHLAFSSGRHYCLGAALARMEGEVGLHLLFERFPDLAVQPGGQRRDTRILRGWATLPVLLNR